jgi:1-acyl-sn-glycerol-3-phosphate acyltransferase
MADAEIIPLGTRGRPGRGTGRDNPSSSSRSLAGRVPRPAQQEDPTAYDEAELAPAVPIEGAPAPAGPEDAAAPDETDIDDIALPAAEETVTPAAPARVEEDRLAGLPLDELVEAVTRAAHVVFGDDAERRLAELLAVLRRRVTGDYTVDEYGLDPDIAERLLIETVRPLATKWFRLEVRGAENIPADGGALLVANHSGTIPLDGLMTMFAVHETTGRNLRPLGADLVFRLPFIGELARKAGATLACNEDASRLLSGGELAGVWPEGFKGIGKPYSERYKLQRFGRCGFVSAAIGTGVPIVPCSIVGAEEIYPLVGNVPFLARLLGMPYIPITPFFPLLGPLGLVPLPSKWIIEFGEPIRTDSYDPGAADDPMLVFNVTDQVRETIQQTLYTLLMRRKSVFH